MNKILKDIDGNIFRAAIVSSIPEGMEEVTIPEELSSEDVRFLEVKDGVVAKRGSADNDRRNEILDKLRVARKPLLDAIDIEINVLMDAGADVSALRTHRQALRDITATFLKVDGNPKVSADTIDIDTFEWPLKPQA